MNRPNRPPPAPPSKTRCDGISDGRRLTSRLNPQTDFTERIHGLYRDFSARSDTPKSTPAERPPERQRSTKPLNTDGPKTAAINVQTAGDPRGGNPPPDVTADCNHMDDTQKHINDITMTRTTVADWPDSTRITISKRRPPTTQTTRDTTLPASEQSSLPGDQPRNSRSKEE